MVPVREAASCSAASPSRPIGSWTWPGRRPSGAATAISAPSMSCSGCSPRARAGLLGCCGPVGWTWWLPERRCATWVNEGWCRRRGPVTPSCWRCSGSTWTPSGAIPSGGSASRRSGRRPGGVTRRTWWRGRRVVWTPLCGPPLVAKRALQLASERARGLGHGEVRPEHLLLGVLEDARQPADMVTGSRRNRRIMAHVGLPDGYRGAAGPLLATLGVDLDRLREDVAAELGGVQR